MSLWLRTSVEGASETRNNSESGINCVSLQTAGPKRGPRKLYRKLGNSETGIWGPLGSEPDRGPRKLVKDRYRSGNRNCSLYSGICALRTYKALGCITLGIREFLVDPRGGVLGNSETGNLEFGGPSGLDPARGGRLGKNSETRNLEYGCPSETEDVRRGGLGRNSELEFGGPLNPGFGLGPNVEGASETRKLGIWNLGGPFWARTLASPTPFDAYTFLHEAHKHLHLFVKYNM